MVSFRLNLKRVEKEGHRLDTFMCAAAAQFWSLSCDRQLTDSDQARNPKSQLSRQGRDPSNGPYPRVRVWMTHLCPLHVISPLLFTLFERTVLMEGPQTQE